MLLSKYNNTEKSEYIDYLKLIENNLHKGNVIIADNAGIVQDVMKNYLDYVRSSGKYQRKYFPIRDDGVEGSTKL